MSQTAAQPVVNTVTDLRRAALNTLRGSLGNLVEWFDVYTYTVFATYFESAFFNQADKNSTVYVYGVFAVTFLMRPVGSWWFGRFADRHGRRAALTLSVSIMAAASMVVAVLPTRSSIGAWAAVLLILCRLVQGFATGGEYGTSATYMSETATAGHRGFLSSFQYVTLVGGQVLAQLVLLVLTGVLTEDQLQAWGWRIPFAIGGVAAVVVFWLRRSMDESLSQSHLDDVRAGRDRQSGSLAELLTRYWRPLLLVFLITMGGTLAFYAFTVNGPATIKAAYKGRSGLATWLNLSALVVMLVLQPVYGWISDRVGRKPLLVWFGVTGVLYAWFLITYLPRVHTPVLSWLMLVGAFVSVSGYTSINALVKAEQFPAHIRALGVGLGYGLANSVFGGTAPMVYQWANQNHQVPAFIVYMTACIAGSLAVYVLWLRNKPDTHLDLEQGHAYRR